MMHNFMKNAWKYLYGIKSYTPKIQLDFKNASLHPSPRMVFCPRHSRMSIMWVILWPPTLGDANPNDATVCGEEAQAHFDFFFLPIAIPSHHQMQEDASD